MRAFRIVLGNAIAAVAQLCHAALRGRDPLCGSFSRPLERLGRAALHSYALGEHRPQGVLRHGKVLLGGAPEPSARFGRILRDSAP